MKVYVNISYQRLETLPSVLILVNISRKVTVVFIFNKKLFNKGHKTRSEYLKLTLGSPFVLRDSHVSGFVNKLN